MTSFNKLQLSFLAIVSAQWWCLTDANGQAEKSEEPPPPIVAIARVEKRSFGSVQEFVGTAIPRRRSVVGSATDGRIIEYHVDAGEYVEKDDPLVQLRTNTLKIERAGAVADLELRQSELEELENGSRPEEIAQAEAKLLGASANKQLAERQLERAERLFKSGQSVSQNDLDIARATALEAGASLESNKAILDQVKAGPRKEKLDQARARVEIQKQTLAAIDDRIDKHTIRAPFSGYVVTKQAEVGQWLSMGDLVVEIVLLDPIRIYAQVPELYVEDLELNMDAQVTLNLSKTKQVVGKIVRIIPQADVKSRTFPVIVEAANPKTDEGHLIKAGMSARVSLELDKRENVLVVPKDSLVLGGQQPIVFKVKRTGDGGFATVHPVAVVTGKSAGSHIQIDGELQEGDEIVVQGNERLRPKQVVKITVRSPAL